MAKSFALVLVLFGGAILLIYLVRPVLQARHLKRQIALNTMLTQAVSDRDEDKALEMLADGADVNLKDRGTPVLMTAIFREEPKVVNDLLVRGADVNAHEDEIGKSVLMCAVDEVVEQRVNSALVERLLKQGANLNAQDANRQTALIWAVNNEYSDKQQSDRQAQLVGLLLAWHPDIEIKDAGGDTALRYAEKEGNGRIAAMLRRAGAKEYSLFPPLVHRVAAYAVTDLGLGRAELINNRGDVIIIDEDGQTDGTGQLLGCTFFWRKGKLIHLGTLGGPSSIALGLNDREQVVGEADTTARDGRTGPYLRHAFLWQDGRMHDLHPRAGWATKGNNASSSAMAINDAGKIVGMVGGTLFVWHGSRLWGRGYQHANITRIHWDGVTSVAANDNAQIVLNLQASGDEKAGILQTNGLHLLPQPPPETLALEDRTDKFSPNYHAYGTNNAGDVVGDTDYGEAALWHRGQFSYLGKLYDMQTRANGLDNKGLIVGVASDDLNVKHPELHACLWQNGKAKDLNSLISSKTGWILEDAHAVNDRGQIVGHGTYRGKEHAFLLTPITQSRNN